MCLVLRLYNKLSRMLKWFQTVHVDSVTSLTELRFHFKQWLPEVKAKMVLYCFYHHFINPSLPPPITDPIHLRSEPAGTLHVRWPMPLVPLWTQRKCLTVWDGGLRPEWQWPAHKEPQCPTAAPVGLSWLRAHGGEGGPTNRSGAIAWGESRRLISLI